MKLSYLNKTQSEMIAERLNLTEDETIIYWMLVKDKSILEIANRLNLSERTVNRRIAKIKEKIKSL